MTDNTIAVEAQKCGFVTVIGAPNAGKSTLVNSMVGAKVSIVTHKVQTTRARVRGVMMQDETQIVFIDTPGIFAPKRRLDRSMVSAAWEGTQGADVTLLLVDAPAYLGSQAVKSMKQAKRAREDTDAIIRKLLALISDLNDHGVFSDTFIISADNGDGLEPLRKFLLEQIPVQPWHYPPDQLSDITDRLMAAEITREKLYLRLHDELPYDTTVETERWTRTKKKELRVDQIVFVARETQKGIVVGKNGQTLKAIGAAAREELTQLLGEPVHLFIHVKVRENWAEEAARYREMGLERVE